MRKTWEFDVKGHAVRVTNSWLHGVKLYIDGDFRDEDRSFLAFGNEVRLSARVGEIGVIEIEPRALLFAVEIDAYFIEGKHRSCVFSSTKRLSLAHQRAKRIT
ncbi:hypothetical protein CWE09_10785 [Aliidiomarina minuta]|uniref:Uncharacterized protein n=1 Tax=Aliidiomarina minuta TaxID=880057 RepID=A0A432W4C2_9GAMM|nr:hypothetical protein [Aliidiomarina minuta]RUO24353.1 hypothetical protein CWE09_10785 [Aliidiomarina minuta]